ncbi:MAG: Formate hydrogenlyase transcriptional activator FhlA [Nitrospirae bacterium]|nr:MAG: sigma-54 dependent transcriptional regulator NifA [Nitrospira sp. OLB3]MBV6470404.1 Formate hydrogenlyase transcriptional activator FhlA [Nitrospirota bacterium]MEB2339589.1 sigma 54-interacting transcriptional regulator [Nitrospirales bacterium]
MMQRATLNFETLLEVTNALNSQRDIESLWRVIADQIKKVIPWDRAGITLYESSSDSFRFYAVITNMATPALAHDSIIPREGSAVGWVYDNRRLHIRGDLQQEQVFWEDHYYVREGLGRMINLPLLVREHCLGTLNIGSVQPGVPDPEDCKFLQQVATQIAYAIDHVLAYEQIKQLSEQLRRENEYLTEEVKASRNLRLVVGNSPTFSKVVDLVRAVAPTDTTVLLLGETGTGKEVLAQALHDLSTRSHKPFIRVNCAALPSGLIESELFGHERGAFTGAQLRRAGRFELAHGGTLFLDEIGDMPLETQAKLLRVLQDGMVDRLGGSQPVAVDVRLIAATNADLQAVVRQGTFRADLFYRLHIFPIHVPPLRERREDIHLLAQHFLAQIGHKLRRPHLTFDPRSLARLLAYHWPGNVRELQNVIERAVILSGSSHVTVDEVLLPGTQATPDTRQEHPANLSDLERRHIVDILERTNWRIYGEQGAAQLLGLNPETLRSRLRKLGIRRPSNRLPGAGSRQ